MAAVDPFRPGEIDHNLIENRAGAAAPKRGVVVPGQTVFCLIGEIDSRLVKIFTRYQGVSRNGGLKALSGAGFL